MYPKQSINYLIVTSRIIPQVAAGHNIRLGFFCFILVINMRLELETTNLQTNILKIRRDLVERLYIASAMCSVLNKYTTG